MKYALIGCGRIATNHIKAVLNNSLELVAVCDIVPERMEDLLAKHGLEGKPGIARYTDYTRLLNCLLYTSRNGYCNSPIGFDTFIASDVSDSCFDLSGKSWTYHI